MEAGLYGKQGLEVCAAHWAGMKAARVDGSPIVSVWLSLERSPGMCVNGLIPSVVCFWKIRLLVGE